MTCPRCTGEHVATPAFTWWGGALGAHLLRRRVCHFCRFAFDARTGTPNRGAVVLYVLATNTLLAATLGAASMLAR